MEKVTENIQGKNKRNEASQKAMKAVLGVTAFTIFVATYCIVLFVDKLSIL